ncbi:hypothetical protein LUZ60_014253 [Juncus effusus]|nr:hypothetical protein LUZ60_014253 [Juncus effusus]
MGKGRAPCCDKVGLNKGSWTPEEDLRLISFIQKYGHTNWRALPKKAGLLRCGKSCRLRWINYLRPDIKRGNFTKEEEETIIKLHELLGNKWSKIASRLPGRTDNEIKNVWNTYLKKKLASRKRQMEENTEESSVCSMLESNSNPNSDENQHMIKDKIENQTESPSISQSLSRSSSSILFVKDSKQGVQEVDIEFMEMPDIILDPEFWNISFENNANTFDEKKNWLEYLELELGLCEPKEGSQETNVREEFSNQLVGDVYDDDFQIEPSPLFLELLYDVNM